MSARWAVLKSLYSRKTSTLILMQLHKHIRVSILRKSISGRHRPVRVAEGPMTADIDLRRMLAGMFGPHMDLLPRLWNITVTVRWNKAKSTMVLQFCKNLDEAYFWLHFITLISIISIHLDVKYLLIWKLKKKKKKKKENKCILNGNDS